MNGETAIGMVDPDDDQKPALLCAADQGVVLHISPDLRRLDSFWVLQRFSDLRAHDAALRMVSLQVADLTDLCGTRSDFCAADAKRQWKRVA